MNQVLATYWDTGFPKASAGPCVALKRMKLVNVPCDNSLGTFYDVSKGINTIMSWLTLKLESTIGRPESLIVVEEAKKLRLRKS